MPCGAVATCKMSDKSILFHVMLCNVYINTEPDAMWYCCVGGDSVYGVSLPHQIIKQAYRASSFYYHYILCVVLVLLWTECYIYSQRNNIEILNRIMNTTKFAGNIDRVCWVELLIIKLLWQRMI